MPRPDPREPGAGQESLFEPIESAAQRRAGQLLRGRHSVAMDKAIAAARDAEVLGDIDDGLATVLRAGAWALDSMETSGHHYGPAKLVPAITEALRDAHMTPEARVTDTDTAIADLLRDLAAAEADDPDYQGHPEDGNAPVSDTSE
ncbi:terminase small subunit [Gordonia phage Rahul]|nr:terminase small subunit [Gordonia phage Rahul]